MSSHLRWTTEFITELHRNGVRHAVISPGSRSTPLTFAAAIHPGIQKKIALDERSAAFIALGIGKATGKPAVLICTSGTAAANYMPAITEAKESGVPMVVLTADRPPNLRGIGSSQTVDQIKLYGDQAVFFHEAGEPRLDPADLKRLRYAARQSVYRAINRGGAAHINFSFRKPLEPTDDEINQERTRINKESSSYSHDQSLFSQQTIQFGEPVLNLISKSTRPVIIAGPADPSHRFTEQINRLSREFSAPVISEPGSGISGSDAQIHRYEQFLRSDKNRDQMKPDLILRFGDQSYTKSILVAIDDWSEIPTIHFSARDSDQDHAMSVTHKIRILPNDRLVLNGISTKTEKNWLDLWKSMDRSSQTELAKKLDSESKLTDGHVFQKLSRDLSSDWNIMLSNSFIPRDMALFGNSTERQFVNRGAAGIDGVISTAIGTSASTQYPTCCIVGDLAFLHDTNALLSIKYASDPFLTVIINNEGGNIFKMLPVSGNQEYFEDYFITPQSVAIESLVRSYGIDYTSIQSIEELKQFKPDQIKGKQIVEVKTDSDAGMSLRKALWGA